MSEFAELPLTPEARRKPTIGGLTVKMADGRDWILARPRVLWVADDTEDGFRACFDLGDEYAKLIDQYNAAEGRFGQIKMIFAIAKYLLRVNYHLDGPEFASLLVLDFAPLPEGSPGTDAQQRASEIEDLILGKIEPPKASIGTSD